MLGSRGSEKFDGFSRFPELVSRPVKMEKNDQKLSFKEIYAFSKEPFCLKMKITISNFALQKRCTK